MSTSPRRSGLSIPLFSLRGDGRSWGVGEIADLVPFARWAATAGFSVVQILPVNEPAGGQDSPYAARTAFALDPVYAALDDVEDFAAAGGLAALAGGRETVEAIRAAPAVDWRAVRELKTAAFALAYRRFVDVEINGRTARALELDTFAHEHEAWLDDYALYAALHEEHGDVAWLDWPEPLRRRDPAALREAHRRLYAQVDERRYVQWQLDKQWRAARAAVEAAGVTLMGDLQFMVAGDSADVWARANEFRLDARLGVPPDAFSADGQDWGLPVYRWDVMAGNDLAWMRARGERAAALFGLYRVDHVVGLYRTYFREHGPKSKGRFTPAVEAEQIANGERNLRVLGSDAHRVIAEDLGVVPDFVRQSLTKLNVPGYKVVRWEKDDAVFRDPAAYGASSVATTGTHDTEPMSDWWDALAADERDAFLALPGLAALAERKPTTFDDEVRDAILALTLGSASELALVPFQDAFGDRQRINVPGTVGGGNWTYRMPIAVADLPAVETERLARLNRDARRK